MRYQRTSWLFVIALSLLISHELDAMLREEWLLFPGFGRLSPGTAADVFNVMHVPLFALILLGFGSARQRTKQWTMLAVETFLVGHAVAHALFRSNADYQFVAPVETLTVYGAATVACAHLISAGADKYSPRSSDENTAETG